MTTLPFNQSDPYKPLTADAYKQVILMPPQDHSLQSLGEGLLDTLSNVGNYLSKNNLPPQPNYSYGYSPLTNPVDTAEQLYNQGRNPVLRNPPISSGKTEEQLAFERAQNLMPQSKWWLWGILIAGGYYAYKKHWFG